MQDRTDERPLVSVITPVYNGAAYIADCIESVLNQTYGHWEYVIVDNASTDGTAEIVAGYAERDRRIRVHRNPRTVPVIENHNIGLRHVAADTAWCKFVYADDLIFPECLDRMLAVATQHPSIGLVSAYRLQGDWVDLDGLPYPTVFATGRTIARWSLLGLPYVFGAPTAHMIRADFVRRRACFYDESNLHADEAACYEVLQSADFGFVHQVLSFSRVRADGLTCSVARRLNTFLPGWLKIRATYGPVFLSPEEYREVLDRHLALYYKFLAEAFVAAAPAEVWRFHRQALQELGFPLSRRRLLGALARLAGRVFIAPGVEVPKVLRTLRHRAVAHGDDTPAGDWHETLEAARRRSFVKAIERQDAARVLARGDQERGPLRPQPAKAAR